LAHIRRGGVDQPYSGVLNDATPEGNASVDRRTFERLHPL